jgi:hypothetical protein
MKVIVTGASTEGTVGEIHGYTITAEQSKGDQPFGKTILAVRWRGRALDVGKLMEALATSTEPVWVDREPGFFTSVEEVGVGSALLYANLLKDELETSLDSTPTL